MSLYLALIYRPRLALSGGPGGNGDVFSPGTHHSLSDALDHIRCSALNTCWPKPKSAGVCPAESRMHGVIQTATHVSVDDRSIDIASLGPELVGDASLSLPKHCWHSGRLDLLSCFGGDTRILATERGLRCADDIDESKSFCSECIVATACRLSVQRHRFVGPCRG